ncbi:hypothetical protein PM082_004705 [Marasmius tenuissimus]|nr:hypothetical protein PM082_004705 [Marasmius tenuissimus]
MLAHQTTYYLVRWEGESRDEDSWEPASNLKNTPEKVKEYKKLGLRPVRVIEMDEFFENEVHMFSSELKPRGGIRSGLI